MNAGLSWAVSREPRAVHSLELRTVPDPVLRAVCEPVEVFGRPLRELVDEMLHLMRLRSGVGLAAPQVGIERRLFAAEIEGRRLEVVNPRLFLCGRARAKAVEGCLSLPGVEVEVSRAVAVQMSGRTPEGAGVSLVLRGLWARVVQHEVDHLDGRLICDHAPTLGAIAERGMRA